MLLPQPDSPTSPTISPSAMPSVTSSTARDSAGLDARARARNLRGAVRLRSGAVPAPGASAILVDDVLTTGATVTESVRVLAENGVDVAAVVVLAAA